MRTLLIMLALAGCGDDSQWDGDAAPGTGRIHTSWTVRVAGVPTACESVGAAKVEITTYVGGEGFADRFLCTDGEGTTGSLAAGELAAYIILLNPEDNMLAQAAYNEPVVVIGGETTEIGPYFFDL